MRTSEGLLHVSSCNFHAKAPSASPSYPTWRLWQSEDAIYKPRDRRMRVGGPCDRGRLAVIASETLESLIRRRICFANGTVCFNRGLAFRRCCFQRSRYLELLALPRPWSRLSLYLITPTVVVASVWKAYF